MPNDEINVVYDRNGVPSPSENNRNGFSTELTAYLYPKINNVPNEDYNGEVEFTNTDIQNYNLDVTNNKINISSTRKLINYLKALVRKTSNNIYGEIRTIETNLNDLSDYVETTLPNSLKSFINGQLSDALEEVNDELDDKADIDHTHGIGDIVSLNTTITSLDNRVNSKASSSDFMNHVNNKNNPHEVKFEQLGVFWEDIPTNDYRIRLFVNKKLRIGFIRIQGQFTGINTTNMGLIYVIPQEYRPLTDLDLSASNRGTTTIYVWAFDGGVRIDTPLTNGYFYANGMFVY